MELGKNGSYRLTVRARDLCVCVYVWIYVSACMCVFVCACVHVCIGVPVCVVCSGLPIYVVREECSTIMWPHLLYFQSYYTVS